MCRKKSHAQCSDSVVVVVNNLSGRESSSDIVVNFNCLFPNKYVLPSLIFNLQLNLQEVRVTEDDASDVVNVQHIFDSPALICSSWLQREISKR